MLLFADPVDHDEVLQELHDGGLRAGGLLAVVLREDVGLGLALGGERARMIAIATTDPLPVVVAIEQALGPRWVWWSKATAAVLTHGGARVARCWDLAAVHRLQFGGWRADPATLFAALQGLPENSIPTMGQLNLLDDRGGDDGTDLDDPVRPDGHLRPEWVNDGWARDPQRMARWAATAMSALEIQRRRLGASPSAERHDRTARSESAAELLCAELEFDGLPLDVASAEAIIASFVGPRNDNEHDAAAARAGRDQQVLQLVPASNGIDLRNPADVKSLLHRIGLELADTRAWRLEQYRDTHPVVDALLTWRKAERIATTYGYAWLETHVGSDGRLRGAWSGSDGAAGRMTAQAGLHNMPAEMRPAVRAEPGFVFVRADLGQIEPRVLAAVSGDLQLAAATAADDMYAPVAARLGVERSVAKVAVLASMYGQTSGAAGQALQGLEAAYPTAMNYLRAADEAGRRGDDVSTYGGRVVRMWATPDHLDERERRTVANARGRFARNAVVQGAAAELFKAWAVTVRARAVAHGASIALCLHDELLVHAPQEHADEVVRLVDDCLQEAAWRWAPNNETRFVADTSIVARWSDAKP